MSFLGCCCWCGLAGFLWGVICVSYVGGIFFGGLVVGFFSGILWVMGSVYGIDCCFGWVLLLWSGGFFVWSFAWGRVIGVRVEWVVKYRILLNHYRYSK